MQLSMGRDAASAIVIYVDSGIYATVGHRLLIYVWAADFILDLVILYLSLGTVA